jgi:hypothetical protein
MLDLPTRVASAARAASFKRRSVYEPHPAVSLLAGTVAVYYIPWPPTKADVAISRHVPRHACT